MDATAATLQQVLLFGLLPLWVLTGAGDWWMHRRERIEHTAGVKESALHFLMMLELAPGIAAALLLDVTAATLLFMLACCVAHELTVWWDLRYAVSVRRIPVVEQWLHGFQTVLPWAGLAALAVIHRDQVLAVWGPQPADWGLRWKDDGLSALATAGAIVAGALFIVVPFSEELVRCLRAARQRRTGRSPAS